MNHTEADICRGYLSDQDYLKHMIPHHQVAIDISILLQKKHRIQNARDIKTIDMDTKL